MVFACIFVPDFPVEAVVRAESRLRDHAVAVLAGTPPLVRVYALNEKARAAGAELGMTNLQAEACPGLQLRPRSSAAEQIAHAALLDCAQSFSPRVEDTADDRVIVDLTGLERLFGPPAKIARDLARRAAEIGLETHVAVASNPDAAMHAAVGFPGVTVIPEHHESERLGDLPLEVLLNATGSAEQAAGGRTRDRALTPDDAQMLLETLERWGVRTFRALAALPPVALTERLGQQGLRLQLLARGAAQRTLVPADPPLTFEEVLELEYPISVLEPLAFVLNHMLEQLCARLDARALATNALRIRLEIDRNCLDIDEGEKQGTSCHDSVPASSQSRTTGITSAAQTRMATGDHPSAAFYERTLHLPVPMLNAKTFLKLLQIELSAHPPGAPVKKVCLTMQPVRPRASQSGLFLPSAPEPEKLELTLARIGAIVGESRVGAAEILDTHRADGFRLRRFAPPITDERLSSRPARQGLITALRLFRPPLRASVVLHAGMPVRLTAHTELRGEIVWAAGPWHGSGEWWNEQAWAREEWDVVLQNLSGAAALYRLFRDPATGQWFVYGSYD